jgi:hypothetical protein
MNPEIYLPAKEKRLFFDQKLPSPDPATRSKSLIIVCIEKIGYNGD